MQHLQSLTDVGRSVQQVVEHVANDAIAINHVGDTRWQQAQGLGDAEGAAQRLIPIAQEGEGKLVVGCKSSVADNIVTTHSPDLRTQRLKFAVGITKTTGFGRATRCFVFGVEEQHQWRSVAFAHGAGVSLVVIHGDGGSTIASTEGHGPTQKRFTQP